MTTVSSSTTSTSTSQTSILTNLSPSIKEKKLNLRDIFLQIEEYVCQVTTLRGKCSGVFIGNKHLLVPFHAIALDKIKDLPEGRAEYNIYPIDISYQGTTYTAKFLPINNLDIAQYYDCCLFEVIDEDFKAITSPPPFTETPVPGDKIYFAGYPLTQKTPSFHKGYISSVDETEVTLCFNIDSVVLPGSSGGPVFIKKENKIFLIGVVFAELAQIDSQFLRERQAIQDKLEVSRMVLGDIDVCKVMNDVLDTVFDNLATGVGKVMSIKHVQDLTTKQIVPTQPSPFHFGFPVIKTEKLPGMLGKDMQYRDWYHREVKPNKPFCASIVGQSYEADDLIDKKEELVLREYYTAKVVNNPTKGHQPFEQTIMDKFRKIEDKILRAKPKALKNNKEIWKQLLEEYKAQLPENEKEKAQALINDYLS